jgi:hypothetical protein
LSKYAKEEQVPMQRRRKSRRPAAQPYSIVARCAGTPSQQVAIHERLTLVLRSMIDAELAGGGVL